MPGPGLRSVLARGLDQRPGPGGARDAARAQCIGDRGNAQTGHQSDAKVAPDGLRVVNGDASPHGPLGVGTDLTTYLGNARGA